MTLTSESTSEFVEHVPCTSCGSSDAAATYTDGHTYCHACEAYTPGEGEPRAQERAPRAPADLLEVEVEGIPKRGISQETAEKWGYGYAVYRGEYVQVATYRDTAGNPVAQHLRTREKDFPWRGDQKRAGLYGQHLWRDGRQLTAKSSNAFVVITEGELDAMSVSQVQGNRWPVVSIPNGAPNAAKDVARALGWLETFSRVVIMFDMDDPGREAAEAVARLLTPGKAYIAKLPLKDANEMLLAGREQELRDAIWGAQAWRPSGIITGEDIWAGITRAPQPTVARWPYPEIDDLTRGFRLGEITLLVAGTGAGKSTVARNLSSSFIDQGLKVGVISLEEPWEQYAYSLLGMRAGVNVRLSEDGQIPEGIRDAFDACKDKLVLYDDRGERSDEAIFDRLRHLALAEGCQVVIIDHLTVVIGASQDADDRRHAERFMSELEALTKRTKVIPIVVMHLRKTGEGLSHEDGRKVRIADIKGSGMIPQLSHNIVAVERDQNETTVSRLVHLKCRWRNGSVRIEADHLKYDESSGRLAPYDPALEQHDVEDLTEEGGF